MFSIYGFHTKLASSTTAATALTPVTDAIATVASPYLYVPALSQLLGGYLIGQGADQAYIQTPSLLQIGNFRIAPLDTAAAVPASPLPLSLQPASPVKLNPTEGMQFFSDNANSSNQYDTVGIVFLSDGPIAPVNGDIRTIKATCTTSATGFSWQNAALTFSDTLPAGNYNLVGMRVEGAHVLAARVVFQGNASVRPGCIGVGSATKLADPLFRKGNLGVWGAFSQFNPPSLDVMTDGTSETAVIFLDIIKTG